MALVWTRAVHRAAHSVNSVQVSVLAQLYSCNLTDALCSVLLGMLLWNYYLCVMTDPGQVPRNWVRRNVSLFIDDLT